LFVVFTKNKNYQVEQIKEDEVVGACSMHGKDQKCTKFLSEDLKGRDVMEDLGVSGR
jgi:hypothetical protein